MWGCAQVLYFCSQGDYAYEDDEEVLSKELEFKVEVGEECEDLMRKMLSYDVEDRLTAREVLDHPWLKDSDV